MTAEEAKAYDAEQVAERSAAAEEAVAGGPGAEAAFGRFQSLSEMGGGSASGSGCGVPVFEDATESTAAGATESVAMEEEQQSTAVEAEEEARYTSGDSDLEPGASAAASTRALREIV